MRRDALLETIETQRLGCELAGSPLYAAILEALAADVAAGGIASQVLAPHRDAPFGDAVLLRLLAGLHALVLAGDAPELAVHYPSVGGTPGSGVGAAALDALRTHRARVEARMTEGVQTNEVGRSAALLGGFLEVAQLGLPLRVFELGASAGLNLVFDRYRYDAGDGSGFGPDESELAFDRPWFGPPPDLSVPLVVAERRGCDLAPIDVTSAAGRTRLRSFVWADQPDRRARLDAAIAVASTDPPPIDRASADRWLEDRLDASEGTAAVVTHSIVFQYLPAPTRRRVLDAIERAGARATPTAPVAWLRLEPGGDQAELRLTTWPDGRTHVLARSSYHGPPVVWQGRSGR